MTTILLLILALFAVIAVKFVAFTFAAAVFFLKVGIAAFVGWMLWNCFTAAT